MRTLPNKVEFGCEAIAKERDLELQLWITNNTDKTLRGLVVQNCVMLAQLAEFDQLSSENKLISNPFVAGFNAAKNRWIITGWQQCVRPWANPPCPCIHSDPQFPDCEPGATERLRGVVTFYEGTDVQSEFARLEKLLEARISTGAARE